MSTAHDVILFCKRLTMVAALSVSPTLAHALDWGQWEDAVKGGGSTSWPSPTNCAKDPKNIVVRHAHWVCMHRINSERCPSEYCWEGQSDVIYKCPDGKFMRALEKVRYTNAPCGKADWAQTQYYASLYGETWAKGDGPAQDPTSRSTPPTEADQLPSPPSGTEVSWGSGLPPELEQQAKDDPNNPANKRTAKTDSGKTAEPAKQPEKKVNTTTGSGEHPNRPKKAVRKSTKRRHTAGRADDSSHNAQPAESVSIGIGFGGGGHRREGGRDSGGHGLRRD